MSDREQSDWWKTSLHALTRRIGGLGPVLTVVLATLVIVGVGVAIAGTRRQFSHNQHPSWVLLWRGPHGERYYIDVPTIHPDSAGIHVVAFKLGPVEAGAPRGRGPRQVVQRLDATYHCDQRTVDLSTATTVQTGIRSYASGGYEPVIIGGAAQDHGLSKATWEYLCHPPREVPAPRKRSR